MRHDAPRGLNLSDTHFGEADLTNLALVTQRLQETELLIGIDVRVDSVELEEVDLFDAETAKTPFALLTQVLGPTALFPPPGPRPHESRLGGDGQVLWVGIQRLANELLGDVRPIGVGGVNQS